MAEQRELDKHAPRCAGDLRLAQSTRGLAGLLKERHLFTQEQWEAIEVFEAGCCTSNGSPWRARSSLYFCLFCIPGVFFNDAFFKFYF